MKAVNSEDLEETPKYFTVEDDDFGLSSLLIFKSTAAYLTHNDCYHGYKSRNKITLHATVCYVHYNILCIYVCYCLHYYVNVHNHAHMYMLV